MNIIQAINDENLFRPFLADKDGSLSTWKAWRLCLRALYGLPIASKHEHLLRRVTGRDVHRFPPGGFDSALFVTGRRSGKSRIAAVIGAYEAALAGHEDKLAKGERGIVPIISVTKRQSRIVKEYIRAIFQTPLLKNEVVEETKEGFELRTGTRIEILAGDWRTIRGYTLLAAIVDEVAFFGLDEESKVKSDTELVRALMPALATVGGKIIAITSPYARKGWCWQTYERNFGKDAGTTLVVNCPSRTLNPTLPQKVVDQALAEDYAAAKSEYLGEFREDVGEFIPRQIVKDLVVPNRFELLPQPRTRYFAFVDMSGGRGDAAALAIGHKEERTVVVDFVKLWKPPFDPYQVVKEMAQAMRRYDLSRVTGDKYAAEFNAQAFRKCGIKYESADRPKSQLYIELLPRLCSREIELLDNQVLVNQLAGLERRTRSGGKDIIDHPPGGHDDLANAVAGLVVVATHPQFNAGNLFRKEPNGIRRLQHDDPKLA
jgi:hypothetical protein